MAYQVLARKWRPQDFDSVVGQAPVVQALRNGLADGRIAQAYLFSGIRGIGKTSVARVLAKALNCPNGSPSDPCNQCETCAGIAKGSDLDVLEIDAATYSKVEQVRELTDSLQYGPARDKYKVVIIDEIHRLSRQAFDALLKIVEEPPAHLVFIFATTESEAVPATVLSRCQTFQFRRVPLTEMVQHLRRVSDAEELTVSEHALNLIARASEGSVRDAIALLDQLATFGGGAIADEEVGRILGGVDLALFLGLIEAILGGDRDTVLDFTGKVEASGWDPRHVYGEFLSYCRDALHLAIDPKGARVDLPGEETTALAEIAGGAGYENLLRLLNLLLESEMTVRRSEAAGLALEVALLRAAELPKLTAIEELIGGGGSGADGEPAPVERKAKPAAPAKRAASSSGARKPAAKPPADRDSASKKAKSRDERDRTDMKGGAEEADRSEAPAEAASDQTAQTPPSPAFESALSPDSESRPEATSEPEASVDAVATSPPDREVPASEIPPIEEPPDERPPIDEPPTERAEIEEPEDPPETPIEPPTIRKGREVVTQLLDRISYLKQPLAAHLSSAQSLSIEDQQLLITTAPGDHVLEKTLHRASNRELLEKTLHEMLGPSAHWQLRAGTTRASSRPEEGDDDATLAEVSEDPTVQTVLDLFGGQIQDVEQRDENADEKGASR